MVGVTPRRNLLAGVRELGDFGEVLSELVKRDLKARYKRSVLGLVWTLLNPLLMMAVTTLVFSHLFRFAVEHFPLYMLSAYVLWGFFSQGTLAASTSLLTSAGLAQRIYLPPALFPIAAVNAAAVNLLVSLLPLLLLMVASGVALTWSLAFVPVALALAILFTCGVALLLAAASVFFHDMIHMYQVIIMAWMYLTPIFYPPDIVPEEWSFVFRLNPMYHMVQIFRDPIYAGVWPDPINVAAAAGYAFGTAALGWWYFDQSRNDFSGYL